MYSKLSVRIVYDAFDRDPRWIFTGVTGTVYTCSIRSHNGELLTFI